MSDALRLAEWVESDMTCEGDAEIAAELRRLHDLVTEDSILQRRQRDEIAQLGQALKRAIERNNELEALNAELVEALREMLENGGDFTAKRDAARAALAKVEASK